MSRFLLLGLLLVAALPSWAQQTARPPDCIVNFRFTATGTGGTFDNRGTGCTSWSLRYQATGFTGIALQVDRATDNTNAPGTFAVWPAFYRGTVMAIFDQITAFGFSPWVRVNLTAATGTGQVTGVLEGWRGPVRSTLLPPCNALRFQNCQ